MPSDKVLKRIIEQEASRLKKAMAAVEYWCQEAILRNKKWREEKEEQIQQKYQQDMQDIFDVYSKAVDSSKTELTNLKDELGLGGMPWSAQAWEQENLSDLLQSQQVAHYTRFGSYQLNGPYSSLTTPALLPIIGHKNVLIKASGPGKQIALDAMQSIMLRLLATLPPGKLQFTLIDPVGLGSNVAGFVSRLPEELTGGNAWYESHHIEQRLVDLSAHMATVIQKYLGNQYPTIEDYNEEAGEVKEPYRFLVVANFPINFTEEAAKRLVSIATNGPRTGVYVLVMVDTEQPRPHGFNLADLEHNANLIEYQDNEFVWREPDYQNWPLSLDGMPPTQTFDKIIDAVGKAALEASKVEVPFERIVPSERDWWSKEAKTNLEAPIGQRGAKDVQTLDLGKGTAIHALIAGKTGSGKSNLLHVLITSLGLTYSPDELELYLIDFKKGVEFKVYATHKLPHARVIAIQSEREFGHSVLEALDAELQRRGDLFRDMGCNDLQDYREKDISGQKLPRILLLVDEFQEFFSEDDALASHISLILDRLVRQGRAFGIHVLLGSQSLAGTYSIARSTTDQMAVRIALQCSDEDSRRILSEDNPAARLLSRPGEAIYNSANGLVEGNNLFQVVLLNEQDHQTYLRKIRERTQATYPNRVFSQIVFEGNSPAELEANQQISEFRRQQRWSSRPRTIQAWLGEPIAIRPHVAAVFRRQQRSNLVIIGQNEEMATAMLFSSLLSISLQVAPQDAQFYVINLSSVDYAWNEIPQVFSKSFPHTIKIIKRRKIPQAIEELANLVTYRETLDDEADLGHSVFLIVIGLHRARDLRVDENYYPAFDEEVKVSTGEQFCNILRDGPDFGIHTLLWCDTYASFTRTIPRQYTGEFDLRVALQMTTDDSMSFIDSPIANKLGPIRALFLDEEQVGRLEKFRPYRMISEQMVEEVGQELNQRI